MGMGETYQQALESAEELLELLWSVRPTRFSKQNYRVFATNCCSTFMIIRQKLQKRETTRNRQLLEKVRSKLSRLIKDSPYNPEDVAAINEMSSVIAEIHFNAFVKEVTDAIPELLASIRELKRREEQSVYRG